MIVIEDLEDKMIPKEKYLEQRNLERGLTKRTLGALATKEKIFKIALMMFSKYGYENVTINAITKKAGVSKGTFYTHFISKESVLVEQFKMIDNHYDEELEKLSADSKASEELMCIMNSMADYCANKVGIDFLKIVYMSQISSGVTVKILNNKDRKLYKHLYDIVNKGLDNGEFKVSSKSIDEIVEWIMRSARGMIYDWCLYDGEIDLVREAKDYFSAIVKILKTGI